MRQSGNLEELCRCRYRNVFEKKSILKDLSGNVFAQIQK